MIPLLLALFAGSAQAAPPSATLSGSDGTLAWTVSSSGGAVQIQGSSPKWKVQHTADANMRPRATTRTDPDGKVTKVTYEAGVVTVTLPGGKVVTHKGARERWRVRTSNEFMGWGLPCARMGGWWLVWVGRGRLERSAVLRGAS